MSSGTRRGAEPLETSDAHAVSIRKAMCADSAVNPWRARLAVSRERSRSERSCERG